MTMARTIWEECERIMKEAEARKVVREFLDRKLKEAMGSNASTGEGESGAPEESEVEETY